MRKLGIALLLAVSTTAPQANADARMRLTVAESGYACDVSATASLVTVYALLEYAGGASGVTFAAPVPANSGFTLLASGSPFTVSGDLESGVDVQFGGCLNGTVPVMTMFLLKSGPGDPCTFFGIAPHPTFGEASYTDCQEVRHALRHGSGVILNSDGTCPESRPPYDPFPPHAATGVPLFTHLSWSYDEPDCCTEISGRRDTLYFGTTPDPPIQYDISSPEPIGPLQPATTYYWKIVANAYGCAAESPVWSFMTTADVAVHPTTWGAIKALYR